jgi:hypothetical protein
MSGRSATSHLRAKARGPNFEKPERYFLCGFSLTSSAAFLTSENKIALDGDYSNENRQEDPPYLKALGEHPQVKKKAASAL